jgi:hypothetical protein
MVRLSASCTGRLYPQECSWHSFSLGAESNPWYGRKGTMSLKNPQTPPGIDSGTFRLVAQRLDHYATPGSPLQAPSRCFLTADPSVLSVHARFVLLVSEKEKFLHQYVRVFPLNHYSTISPHPSITAL